VNQTILTITTLSTQGEGIARVEGKAFFVPFTLPGEIWKVRIIEQKKNYGRAMPVELIERSEDAPERILPACPYFGACGGCHLQHMPYRDHLEWKRRWLQETFRRIGHLDVEPNPTVESPPWEYRNKLTLNLRNAGGRIVFAFHHIHQPNRPVVAADCPVAHSLIRRVMPDVLEAVNAARPRIVETSRTQPQGSRIQLRVVGDRVEIVFIDAFFSPTAVEQVTERIFRSSVPIAEIILEESTQQESKLVSYTQDEVDSAVSSDSFYQINDAVREKLYQYTLALPFQKNGAVLDGYCGVGILTSRLAERFTQVTGVELNESAVRDANRAVKESGLQDRVQIVQQPLERFLDKCSQPLDCYILNPPRAGLSEDVRHLVKRNAPPEIVVISCHPAALARDSKIFVDAGYSIQSLQPFDMFPQTYHLETVAYLRKG
jgi:23S rRNA (uracil1939-C5)-methyltransferase